MAHNSSKIWLYQWWLSRRRHQKYGFTLIELLVSILIAGIVVSGLLFLIVELLRVDRREIALEQVQRDMQRAIDYMADDLKEAVYVYSNPATDIVQQIPALDTQITSTNSLPVLAFWRTVPIADDDLEALGTCSDEECRVAKTRRATYSLIVYYQEPRDTTDSTYPWKGESVLRRFELAKYNNLPTDLSITPGYRDPVDNEDTLFEGWTPDGTVSLAGTTRVLVDYVHGIVTPAASGDVAVNCRNLISGFNSSLTGETNVSADQYDYELSPASVTNTTGMFACIRDSDTGGEFRANQDVFLFLKGNANSFSEFLQPASAVSRLPVLQTQVELGGVVNRDGE